jgi:hypothetical protein
MNGRGRDAVKNEMERRRDGEEEMGRRRDGESERFKYRMESFGETEMERDRDGKMERWRDEEMKR